MINFIFYFFLILSHFSFTPTSAWTHPNSSMAEIPLLEPPRLAPPWWLLDMKLKASFGKTPGTLVGGIEVLPPQSCWGWLWGTNESTIPITTSTQEAANGLATLLKTQYTAGGMNISLDIRGPEGPGVAHLLPPSGIDVVSYIEGIIHLTLRGNPYFVTVHRLPARLPLVPLLFVEFSTTEIQIHDDNIDDYYGYDTSVAEHIFREFMNSDFFDGLVPTSTTTTPVAGLRATPPVAFSLSR